MRAFLFFRAFFPLGLVFFFLAACGSEDTPSIAYCDLDLSTQPSQEKLTLETREDPLLSYQNWYLDKIGIKRVWEQGHYGEKVHISIVDDALEIDHPDLRANILPNRSRNFLERFTSSLSRNPLPLDCYEDGHGTAVAGIIAATADNGIGVKGIAPKAKIYLSNYLSSPTYTNLLEALSSHTPDTAVSSNSWGSRLVTRLRGDEFSEIGDIIDDQLLKGYKNKGVSYVFAGGNNRQVFTSYKKFLTHDRSSYEALLNHRGVIPVCAVSAEDKYTDYSTPGPNLWICGPSGDDSDVKCEETTNGTFWGAYTRGLATTDLSGEPGYNGNDEKNRFPSYLDFGRGGDEKETIKCGERMLPEVSGDDSWTRFFTGTSAATPVVSAVIGILRAEYPDLSWRDVKLILAESARRLDEENPSWQQGAPAYHNNQTNYFYSSDYGFGFINASAALVLAKSWIPINTEIQNEMKEERTSMIEEDTWEEQIMFMDSSINFVEYVNIHLETDYPNFAELNISLISPLGTESLLVEPHHCLVHSRFSLVKTIDCADLADGFWFGSAAHLGEDAGAGMWTLRIDEAKSAAPLKWKLQIWGH